MDVLGIGWQPSSFHGWGVFGLNFAEQMLKSGRARPLFVAPFVEAVIDPPPHQAETLSECLAVSAQLAASLSFDGQELLLDIPLVVGLGDDFQGLPLKSSAANHAVIFQERTRLSDAARERAKAFEVIVAGSGWLGRWLEAEGVGTVKTVLQGIDPGLFHPRERPAEDIDGVFRVFSGGKMEYRKGQDIVIAAFRRFRERHADARLVFSWDNPYPGVSETVAKGGLVTAPPGIIGPGAEAEVSQWLQDNDLAEGSFENLGAVPNRRMPDLLSQMDVGVFASRAEGGTNLVAMECMAMGVPTILSANTGHLDLIEGENCFALSDQSPVDEAAAGPGTDLWRESSVDELVETLEHAYENRAAAADRGRRGAEALATLSWEAQIAKLLDAIGW